MAGIIHKIEEKLHLGGSKQGDQHKPEHGYSGDHKPEHKEGMVEKIKDKIRGGKGEEHKKKKKEKKNKKDRHEHGHSSSSSDSD